MTLASDRSADSRATDAAPWVQVLASRHLVDWLSSQRLSLAATTYQANKLCLLGITQSGNLGLFERTFPRCMGLVADADAQTLWLSSQYQIWRFDNLLPPDETDGEFDRLFAPRVGYVTGDIDVHDIVLDATQRPVFVNTLFSCLATVSDRFNFECYWKPPFISRLAAEDRCHMNGLAVRDGQPRYVTLCSQSDIVDGWRDHRHHGGCVYDIQTNSPIADGLSMPHSPRWHRGRLWLLEAGTGQLGFLDPDTGLFERVTFLPGYARGMAICGDFAIVGTSQPRHEKTFQGLALDGELAQRHAEARCGLQIIDLTSGTIAHWLRLEGKVHELYDVITLPGVRRPKAYGFQTDEIRFNVAFQEDGQVRHWKGQPKS